MTLRIESLFGDETDPLPDEPDEAAFAAALAGDEATHAEDRLLADFDRFLARRGASKAERALGGSLLLVALDQIGDPEVEWQQLSLPGCIARVTPGPLPLPERMRLVHVACELVYWLSRDGRLGASARRRLLRELVPAPRPAPRARVRSRLAA